MVGFQGSILPSPTFIRVVACWIALAVSSPAQQYASRAFRQAEGLRNLSTRAMTTDRDGFLWVATEDAAYRFLGSGFQRFGPDQGLLGLDIAAIVSDPEGTIWAATDENLFRWTGSRFVPASPGKILVDSARRMVVEDSRHLLMVERGKLYRLEHDANGNFVRHSAVLPPDVLSAYPALQQIASVSVTRTATGEEQVWLSAGEHLYSLPTHCLDLGTENCSEVTEWTPAKGLAGDQWRQVLEDHSGTIWAAGLTHIAALLPNTGRFLDRSVPGIAHDSLSGFFPLAEDPLGRILAPAGKSVALWTGTQWQFTGRNNGLNRSRSIVGMEFDPAGDLFLATRGDGVHEWAGYTDWESWNDDQSMPSISVWNIFPEANRVVLGTDRGVTWLDPVKGTSGSFSTHSPWSSSFVDSMGSNPDGSLWAGFNSGQLARVDPGSNRIELLATLPGRVVGGFRDATGKLLVFTSEGVFHTSTDNSHEIPHLMTEADTLLGASALHTVTAGCAASDGTDWIITQNRVLRYRDGQASLPPVDGLPAVRGTFLNAFCSADGSLWLTGDQTGTWRLTPQDGRLKAWQLVLPSELSSLSCLTIRVDRRGWLWLGTDVGVLVWNGSHWRHITEESGLIWNDTNQGALVEAQDGSMWIGTSGGMSHLLHPERIFEPIPLKVAITEVRRGTQDFSGDEKITVPESGPPLRIRFSSPSVHNRSELQFRDREGTGDWVDNSDGILVFPRLRPGTRNFLAMVCDPILDACSAPARFQLVVLPSWWHSTWFYSLCLLAILLLIIAAIRQYVLNLKGRSRELERIVAERTSELETSREMLRVQATHDGLTGLLNRTGILTALAEEMSRARREERTIVIALADLDHFKRINDTQGHLAGDEALRQFGQAIRAAIRPYDHSGRYGGEEFLLVLAHVSPDVVEHRLAALHSAISNLSISGAEGEFSINCSVGATFVDPHTLDVEVNSLLALADKALYEAKATGRNRVVIKSYTPEETTLKR